MVARRQLLEAGLTERCADVRVKAGHLIPLHRGVYAVGHRQLRREGYWLAAVLAAGPGAVLSHREAAALHLIRPSDRVGIDVTSSGRGGAALPGIQAHHARALHTDDVTEVDGIPVTTVARTLVDLAGLLQQHQLVKAITEAERLQLFDGRALDRARERTKGRRGSGHARLTAALAELRALGTTLTRSELDGYANHRTRHAFQRDRTKSNVLAAKGCIVLRFTHDDVVRRPGWVVATVQEARARARATPEPLSPPAPPATAPARARARRAPA